MLYILPVVILVFERTKSLLLEFICKVFLSVCYCISFIFFLVKFNNVFI